MFNNLFKKSKRDSSEHHNKVNDNNTIKEVLHCCCSLSPETFIELMGGTRARLPFITWYKALWIIQHQPDVSTYSLSQELGVSWPTAQDMKKKIILLLTDHHGLQI